MIKMEKKNLKKHTFFLELFRIYIHTLGDFTPEIYSLEEIVKDIINPHFSMTFKK